MSSRRSSEPLTLADWREQRARAKPTELPQPVKEALRSIEPRAAAVVPIVRAASPLAERLSKPGVVFVADPSPLAIVIDEVLGTGAHHRDGANLRGVSITLDRVLWDFVATVRQPGRKDAPHRFESREHIGGLEWVERKAQELREQSADASLPLIVVLGRDSIPAPFAPDIAARLHRLASEQHCRLIVVTEDANDAAA